MTSYRTRVFFFLVTLFLITLRASEASAAEPTKPYVKNLREVINSEQYPEKLKDNPIEGKVLVSIWLDDDGQILKFKVDEANNHDLEQFIKSRVPLLVFEPARDKFGARVYSKVKLPFEFKLDN